jgi:rsbT co-antagonist protein RsbR
MQTTAVQNRLSQLLSEHENALFSHWLSQQLKSETMRPNLISESDLRTQSRNFLTAFRTAINSGDLNDIHSDAWDEVRELLSDLSRARARQGFTPSETATFLFSLKQPLFTHLRTLSNTNSAAELSDDLWAVTQMLDKLGLYTTELYQQSREEIIQRQQEEMLELSTPVVELWEGVLALPLIGTLDSMRTQIVMENLLQRLVETGSTIAIIDITGVPTVDTLVAQHLLKTVAAARLMGADCIISGIRPQIAQTIVHLGIDLRDITTKATLAGAFTIALQRLGHSIIRGKG